MKKWRKRIRAAPEEDQALHSRSRARLHPPPKLDPQVIDQVLAIRDAPPEHLQRVPGPKAILYYLARDPLLQASGLRLPHSSRTIWLILQAAGRIPPRGQRVHHPVERPAPMSSWQLDFKDVSTVPADPDGKQQHVVEVLDIVDVGTSLLVDAQVRPDFTAETTLTAVVQTLRTNGLPAQITVDRDPRFVGGGHQADFPAPLLRVLHCLGIQVTICPPQRPDKNAFVERYHRTFEQECLRVQRPSDLASAHTVTATFRQHYNQERPNQALSCGNQPPAVAFPELPVLPALPATVDPDRWLDVLHGERYVRKVRTNGTVTVDNRLYYIDRHWAGRYVSLCVDAPSRAFSVEYREEAIKQLPIRGLLGDPMPLSAYLDVMTQAARGQAVAGRPIGQQLRLPLETVDTSLTERGTM
ncbi:MAG: IS481-like element ISRm20 family transposase [Chloroflexi bacterium OHK40]